MINVAITTTISVIVSGVIGYLIGLLNNYRKRLKSKQEEGEMLKTALMTMLQSNLTNTYYVYERERQIPDYIYRNWNNAKEIYTKLGGNDYIHVLSDKMKEWDFVKTDILR